MKKIKQEELQQLQQLQQYEKTLVQQLGLLQIQKIELKQKQKQTYKTLVAIQQQSQTLAHTLENTYGQCTIDLDTGEIAPIQ